MEPKTTKTFKSLNELPIGFKITENGIEKDLVFGGLVYTEEVFNIGGTDFNTEDRKLPYHTYLSEKDVIKSELAIAYPGYHICTLEEYKVLQETLCYWKDEYSQRAYLTWKEPEDIPGGLTGVEYISKYVGLNLEGSVTDNNTGVFEITNDRNDIMLDSNDNLHQIGAIHITGGVMTPWTFGSILNRPLEILLVKDRE